jgi:hypothetical protein
MRRPLEHQSLNSLFMQNSIVFRPSNTLASGPPSLTCTSSTQKRLIPIAIESDARTRSASGSYMLSPLMRRMYGRFKQLFRLILVMVSTTLDIATSTKSLSRSKSFPNSASITRSLQNLFRTTSKINMASKSAIRKRTGPKNEPSKSSTVLMKKHTTLFLSIVMKSYAPIPEAQ